MEFKKGKKVRVVYNSNGHCYEIGSIITMDEQCIDEEFGAKELVDGCFYIVRFSDCEEIEEKPFGKQDLKTGMLVQFRNGNVFMLINDTLVRDQGWSSLDYIDKDLNYICHDDEFDIMKVSKVLDSYYLMPNFWNEKRLNNNLLWEREETKKMTISEMKKELEEKLGHKIEIIH